MGEDKNSDDFSSLKVSPQDLSIQFKKAILHSNACYEGTF